MVWLSVFGSVSFAFQSGCPAWDVRFSLLGGGAVRACGYVRVCYGLSLELPLTANGSAIWRIRGKENRILSFHLQYGTVCYHSIGNYIPQSLPVEGGWLRPAARERSSHVLDGTKLVRTRTCTNSTHIPLFHKSFARLFQKPRSPRSSFKYKKPCRMKIQQGLFYLPRITW